MFQDILENGLKSFFKISIKNKRLAALIYFFRLEMGLVPSTGYLAAFASGSLIGAATALFLMRKRFVNFEGIPLEERFKVINLKKSVCRL